MPRDVPDLTAPATTLSGSRLQKLAKTVYVTVACPVEACSATVSATVRVPRLGSTKAKVYKLKTSSDRSPGAPSARSRYA